MAWHWDNIPAKPGEINACGAQNVGTKQANELGLYDMSGNVAEWCNDWFGSYNSSSQTNPTGPTSGSGRVFRGGSWYGLGDGWEKTCRVSYRYSSGPTDGGPDVGLRLVL